MNVTESSLQCWLSPDSHSGFQGKADLLGLPLIPLVPVYQSLNKRYNHAKDGGNGTLSGSLTSNANDRQLVTKTSEYCYSIQRGKDDESTLSETVCFYTHNLHQCD